jgi:hypothetical protein
MFLPLFARVLKQIWGDELGVTVHNFTAGHCDRNLRCESQASEVNLNRMLSPTYNKAFVSISEKTAEFWAFYAAYPVPATGWCSSCSCGSRCLDYGLFSLNHDTH